MRAETRGRAGPDGQGATDAAALDAARTRSDELAAQIDPAAGAPDAAQAAVNAETEKQERMARLVAQRGEVLGHAVWLLARAPEHRHVFIADLDWRLLAPIVLDQFRLWKRNNLPFAFATWAYVGDEVAARLEKGIERLAPNEWRSGKSKMIVDLVAPFGGEGEIRKAAMETMPPRQARG